MGEHVNHLGQQIGFPLPEWTARPRPPRTVMAGRYCAVEPVDPAHVEVGDHDVEIRGSQNIQRLSRGRPPRHFAAPPSQSDRERLAERGVIVDEQDLPRHAGPLRGKYTEKVEPAFCALATVIQPPCSRMIP